ncbi:ATP-binding protein [Desulfoglaeba alkanexedens]|uniref:histidine kinase n=1 Tax=Desulfoglaeba alkanexedens ALDC TaxID=980445 RepID=A0A4V1ERI2_9BACT|nr:ATP-binding protein [Desulfoglaeba alkanexedens]QCQ21731.1 two-component sensor histidine kinase [Desulfoglaeba alkanexedens ALDC]
MSLKTLVKPKFWDHEDVAAGPYRHLFNFRLIWKQAVYLTVFVTLTPLIFMAAIGYRISKESTDSEIVLRTVRLVSNTRRSITYFLDERKAALDFVVHDNSFDDLNDPRRLARLLENLKTAFGGFTDVGVIDSSGVQRAYVGPYPLEGVNYHDEEWFRQVMEQGIYISDVFMGFRQVPHLVIAIRHRCHDGSCYILRATLDTAKFNELLYELDVSGRGDAFLVNHDGVMQTPSRYYGKVLDQLNLPIPDFSERSEVMHYNPSDYQSLLIGYAYIEQTPFILMIVKEKDELLKPWRQAQMKILMFLAISIGVILVVILGVCTFLVNKIFEADQRRVAALHRVEYENKMASIGRLAAGVAHEINNPLAIISEKAGLIQDIFTIKEQYARDEKLLGLVDSILKAVERGATITRRLLSFARHMGGESNFQRLHIGDVIEEVVGFLSKEAMHRSIELSVRVSPDVPDFECDRGRLQQILLNLLNNAFAAVNDGGHVAISVERRDEDHIRLIVSDDGCGIPESDLKRIFEPFFSTKAQQGGTGLGLSITYGLVKELGGDIQVESRVGQGTTFSITLPITGGKDRGGANAGAVGG